MIGERIRKLRIEAGITAKEMAARIDVTPGYISQFERDLTRPSMNVLMKVADVLQVPVAALMSQEESQGKVMVIPREKRTRVKFGDVQVEYEFLTPYGRGGNRTTQMEVLRFTIQPHQWASTSVMLHEESDECSVVLSGTLEYHVDDEVYTVEEGGCIYIPKGTPHRIYNPGDEDTIAIGVLSPACY